MIGRGDDGGEGWSIEDVGRVQLWKDGAAEGVENFGVNCLPLGGFDVDMG